jgi:hypothetical protein
MRLAIHMALCMGTAIMQRSPPIAMMEVMPPSDVRHSAAVAAS